eukprot:2590029-Rhodomonas_salina.2
MSSRASNLGPVDITANHHSARDLRSLIFRLANVSRHPLAQNLARRTSQYSCRALGAQRAGPRAWLRSCQRRTCTRSGQRAREQQAAGSLPNQDRSAGDAGCHSLSLI